VRGCIVNQNIATLVRLAAMMLLPLSAQTNASALKCG
jgi:hypothetical protein